MKRARKRAIQRALRSKERARKRALQRGGVARKLSCKISKKQLAAFNIDLFNKAPATPLAIATLPLHILLMGAWEVILASHAPKR